MAFFGGLFALVLIGGLVSAVLLIPGLWVWLLWQRVQRGRQRPRSAYDDAYVRALESVARRNAIAAAEHDITALL